MLSHSHDNVAGTIVMMQFLKILLVVGTNIAQCFLEVTWDRLFFICAHLFRMRDNSKCKRLQRCPLVISYRRDLSLLA